MAKKSAKKSARRGAKKAARRSRKGGTARTIRLTPKIEDLKPIINDPDTCERVTCEPIGPGEWRVVKDPTRE